MNRSVYYNYIEGQLLHLAASIESQASVNLLTYHIHSENFYVHFLNLLFELQLVNLNAQTQNVAGLDLVDNTNHVVAQVSSTATKQKIESALSKDHSAYAGKYTFKFISISKDASKLKTETFHNPHNLKFNPQDDIFDIPTLLKIINSLPAEKQKPIYDFIKAELGCEADPVKLETNLANIINILSKEDLTNSISNFQINQFEIDKKINYNSLSIAKLVIEDHSINSTRVGKIYTELDKFGANKSMAVLNSIRGYYIKNKANLSNDALFFKIVECVTQQIKESANFTLIPSDELDLCVNILVVDTFIRCKIFENPNNQANVTT
jgi:hypothetical protein